MWGRELLREASQIFCGELARLSQGKNFTQRRMLGDQFFHQRNNPRNCPSSRKDHTFFGREMNSDLLLEMKHDLNLPACKSAPGMG